MKRLISFSVFFIVAIIVWWTTTKRVDDDYPTQQASDNQYIEIFMNEFELTAIDINGKPGYTLHGLHLQQLNDSDETAIEKPVIRLLQQNSQWKVSADSAILNNKNETIRLNANVIMQQQNIEPALTFRTQSLLINTKTQIAQTDTAVEITQGLSNIKSKGMVFNNITNELELSSSVNGYYLSHE